MFNPSSGWRRAGAAAAAAPGDSKECGASLYCSSIASPQPRAGVPDQTCGPGGGPDAVDKPPALKGGGAAALVAVETVGWEESEGAKEMRQLWVVTTNRRAAQLDLSGHLLDSLPQSICRLGALRRLVLDDNLLRTLPDDFGCLHALRELSCDNNRLEHFPPVLAAESMCQLVLLSLASNFIAEIPQWASHLVGLKSFNLQVVYGCDRDGGSRYDHDCMCSRYVQSGFSTPPEADLACVCKRCAAKHPLRPTAISARDVAPGLHRPVSESIRHPAPVPQRNARAAHGGRDGQPIARLARVDRLPSGMPASHAARRPKAAGGHVVGGTLFLPRVPGHWPCQQLGVPREP